MKADFVRQMHRFIAQHKMIENGEIVLVAVSGGADSLALLYGLHALRAQLNCKLHVVHLNHCLRREADADAEFVQQHAAHLDLPCTIQRVEVPRLVKEWKLSVEAAGRKARYQFYESVCTEVSATKVALGHHQDDIAETVLMNLIRGSGASGLKGIAPVRDIKFIRPLVGSTRQQIEAFLTSIGVTPRQDTTNTDINYLRNRVRHELIPQLVRDYNPNIKTGLSRTADVLGAESEYLDTVARKAFETCRIQGTHKKVVLDRVKFRQYHIALQRRMLRQSISEMLGDMNDLYFAHCEAMLNLVEGDAPNTVLALPNNLRFRRSYQQLIFERKPVEIESFAYPVTTVGKTSITILNTEITAELGDVVSRGTLALPDGKFEAIFDYDKLRKVFAKPSSETVPLIVRNRQQGDRFQPYGMRGTKKIKDFLIDAKVPRFKRDSIPLLVCGDEILWVIGYTTSNAFKIKSDTRQYLYLHYVSDQTSP
ncbi:tRNA lysidine(34) synthetase TilS [Candidatus Poribacteria bacterium]|nr:tRNA lysidine(34) synthetase TilS [Candidatus Poribacteria bacterium]MYH79224.1 tRNA lysidine(34) synthetase TilS [Candidatus Poribacteria bacterium]MYK93994.1 tRNA lysidine(34) synthetase TilS [Candidatus Poribacteria bacterium]